MIEYYDNLFNRITIGPSKSSKCKKLKKLKHESDDEIENTIELKKNNDNKYEKIEGNLFKYEGTAIHIIYENDKPWFRAKDVATILEYKNTTEAIRIHVDINCKKSIIAFKKSEILCLKGNKKSTIYISKKGVIALINK